MNLLPKTKILQLQAAISAVALAFLVLAVLELRSFILTGWIHLILIVVMLLVTALFLWRLHAWARKLTQVILAFLVIVIPLAVFNPFFASDYSATNEGELPNWWLLAAIVVPCVALALWSYLVFGKYKGEFH